MRAANSRAVPCEAVILRAAGGLIPFSRMDRSAQEMSPLGQSPEWQFLTHFRPSETVGDFGIQLHFINEVDRHVPIHTPHSLPSEEQKHAFWRPGLAVFITSKAELTPGPTMPPVQWHLRDDGPREHCH